MSSTKTTRQSAKNGKRAGGFTAEERAAMKARARELKQGDKADGESEVLAKVAAMPDGDRQMAERVHAIVMASAPELTPRTWYGMPAYAKDGKVICFFKNSQKFKARYSTLGFSDNAKLDDGSIWPTDFAVMKLTAEVEKRIAALVKQAVS